MSILILIFILWMFHKMEQEEECSAGEIVFWGIAFIIALAITSLLFICSGFIF
jgi:hypothetical protein